MLPPLQLGEVLRGRYKISSYVGHGGMGSIYQAEDLRLEGRLCAIKEVQNDAALPPDTQQQARDQFYREASILARLDHPNLPKVSDFFSSGDRDYLVMDFVPGKDLRAMVAEARQAGQFLAEAEVLGWANQLADALEYLHRQDSPIVHRDIKPSNLKVTPSGLLKLVDFGLVKQLAADERTVTIIQGVGTAYYTPLEQYGGDTGHTDVRTDIYSFGATLYHLLTNEPPTEAKTRFLRADAQRPVRAINPAVSASTEQAVAWAMALHPDDRPPDVPTLRAALQSATGNGLRVRAEGESFVVQPTIRLPNLASRTDRYLAFAAAGLFLVALLLTLFPIPLR
ncbi:MAG: serine/threonine protein kinase [Anaerolineales bacterium]|nr:serine/threonine protein kinase [Anaerolineales bacterium]